MFCKLLKGLHLLLEEGTQLQLGPSCLLFRILDTQVNLGDVLIKKLLKGCPVNYEAIKVLRKGAA